MKEHEEMVTRLKKDGAEILETMTPERAYALMDVCRRFVNIGYELDKIKKIAIYNKEGTLPKGSAFLGLDADKCDLLHMAVGIAGEAAENLEAVCQHVFDGEELDVGNVVEELGDLEFYMEGERQNPSVLLERDETLLANRSKLDGARYKDGYSDEAAQARADKDPLVGHFENVEVTGELVFTEQGGDDEE